MIHEEAAEHVHPGAKEFRPVRSIFRAAIGWTFEIPRKDGIGREYGWVTINGEVSGDRLRSWQNAERNLRAYVRIGRREAADHQEKHA